MKIRKAKDNSNIVRENFSKFEAEVKESNDESFTSDEEEKWVELEVPEGEEKFVEAKDVEEDPLANETSDITNPRFCHELVDLSGYPPFMTVHLRPLSKWSSNLSTPGAESARFQWYKKATEYMKVFFAMGLARGEIMKRLGIRDVTYDTLEARLIEHEGGKFLSMGVAHRYYLYVLQMEACIRMLNKYVNDNIEDANDKKANVVNAIKTIANIHKDTLLTGRELGIIKVDEKGPRRLGELDLSKMETDELKELFEDRFKMFKQLLNDSTVIAGPYARLLLDQKKKMFDIVTEEKQAKGE
jgi:hypothetical protein